MTRHAILYARVSTEDQAEGPSLDEQLRSCRQYAAQHGMVNVVELAEDYTGTTLDRPKFQSALQLLESGKADALVVNYHDRLSRNYIDFLVLRDQLERQDIELHFVDTGQSSQGFEGLLTESIHVLLAHGERQRLIERSRMGKDGLARRGRYVHSLPPYGYCLGDNKDIEVLEDEAEVVRQIFRLYAYGLEGELLSISGVAKIFNKNGVPTQTRGTRGRAKAWSRATIWRILKNEMYIGRWYWGKTRHNGRGNSIAQPDDKWIEVAVPAIIDEQTFNVCQKRLERNKKLSKRNRKNQFLLSGYIRCGSCKGPIVGRSVKRKGGNYTLYYRCISNMDHAYLYQDCPIQHRYIRADKIEPIVVDHLLRFMSNEELIRQGLREMREATTSELLPKQDRLDTIRGLIEREVHRIQRLVERFGGVDDPVVMDALSDEIKRSVSRKDSLIEEQDYLEKELKREYITEETEEYILDYVRKYRMRLRDASYENIRNLMDILNMVTYVYPCPDTNEFEVVIYIGVPTDDDVSVELLAPWQRVMYRLLLCNWT